MKIHDDKTHEISMLNKRTNVTKKIRTDKLIFFVFEKIGFLLFYLYRKAKQDEVVFTWD